MFSHMFHKLHLKKKKSKTKQTKKETMPRHTTHFLLTTKIRSDLGFQYLTEVLKLFKPQSKVSTPTPTLLLKPRGPSTTHNSQVISLKHHKWDETQSQLNIQLSGTKENGTKQNRSYSPGCSQSSLVNQHTSQESFPPLSI